MTWSARVIVRSVSRLPASMAAAARPKVARYRAGQVPSYAQDAVEGDKVSLIRPLVTSSDKYDRRLARTGAPVDKDAARDRHRRDVAEVVEVVEEVEAAAPMEIDEAQQASDGVAQIEDTGEDAEENERRRERIRAMQKAAQDEEMLPEVEEEVQEEESSEYEEYESESL